MNTVNEYIEAIDRKLATGMASEHAHRPLLESFIKSRVPDSFEIINDGKRISCGQPDLVAYKKVGKKFIDIGYIEAKDIGIDLDKEEKSDQLKRYKESLENLIFTDYLEFRFFVHGEKVETIKIADYVDGQLTTLPDNFDKFLTLLDNFLEHTGQKITSSRKLAGIMAKKAKLIKDVFHRAINQDDEDNSLREQYEAFKRILIHDLTYEQFADVYAQTITYGLFTARIHDKTPEDFSRQEARELIPKSNPFLRQLFDYVSGASLDDRVVWVVDSLCEVLRLVYKENILREFSFKKGQEDPVIHFYETFLAEYDSKLRKSRGVWYTPEPVVNFIIRAVDDCLKKYFNLTDGLASREKVKLKMDIEQSIDRRTKSGKAQQEVSLHKVQLLDIATGTGTFIAEVIKQIYQAKFENQQGAWSSYVEEHLLPRLHGFEILMASYAMCHLKIDLMLEQFGYKPKNSSNPKRLSVYLTNSLEEAHPDTGTLFASWLSNEATQANYIKKNTPVMVAFGNPPYSVSSQNKGKWIQELIQDYKKDLNEKKLNLDDDYIKFIRYAEHYIEKTGYGIVAMITNNSFLDGVTHRQMRKHLLETFDTIYIYDLHGDAERDKNYPAREKDKNVFDIKQGVSISVFVKHKEDSKSKQLAEVLHYDSYGNRDLKYQKLHSHSIHEECFKKIKYKEPYYFLVPKDFEVEEAYNSFFQITGLFRSYNSGIETKKDKVCISFEQDRVTEIVNDIIDLKKQDFCSKWQVDLRGTWSYENAKADLQKGDYTYTNIAYRPFDNRKTAITASSSGFLGRPRYDIMAQMLKNNFSLIIERTSPTRFKTNFYVTSLISDSHLLGTSNSKGFTFPLYNYYDEENQSLIFDKKRNQRQPNFNHNIIEKIANSIGLRFVQDHELPEATKKDTFTPLNLLDYIYAILHSPSYREKYKEFLKIDFPRIPYPKDKETFWQLVELGKQTRDLHLLESLALERLITSWDIDGSNIVEKPEYKEGRVYVNDEQYFEGVPEVAWNFYIGGYQPAQKWLKDRKGRELSYDDILHYQKMIVALTETDRLMKEIDKVYKP